MRNKAPLILMEQLIMVLVFALAAAVCVRAFVLAENISKESAARDRAMLEAQTAAEYAKSGQTETYLRERNGAVNGNAGFAVSFDQDWNSVSADDDAAAYTLWFTYRDDVPEERCYLWSAEIEVKTAETGAILYTLPVAGQNGEMSAYE
jgi:hypothetical protein